MKFFLDTGNIQQIKEAVELGMCDGVTTNPSLIAKEGRDHKQVIQEICKLLGNKPVSVEGIGDTAEQMVKDAEEFVAWGKGVVVKIPMTKEGLKAVRILSQKGIKTNVTLVFSPAQALLIAKAGATYVSPFVGRLDDIGQNGMNVISDIMEVYKAYGYKTEVIVASIRSVDHVVEAAKLGAHIATIPAKVMDLMWKHELTDKGIEIFNNDWKKSHEKK
ncbi:MAG: fructose-6-phosphate aldolase [Candidatus Micrarchaeota archaeon]